MSHCPFPSYLTVPNCWSKVRQKVRQKLRVYPLPAALKPNISLFSVDLASFGIEDNTVEHGKTQETQSQNPNIPVSPISFSH